ncbi:MAG: hypothetical protein IAF38_15475, partial [Bacteroidia bacterium]|nr:hypothetical protein [Bacteroidia bacterium]
GDFGQTIVGYFLPADYTDNLNDKFRDDELKLDAVALNSGGLLAVKGKVSGKT